MPSLSRRRFLFVASAATLLAGCESPPRQVYPELTWTHLPPLKLNVARIDIVEEYVPPMGTPNVDHLSPRPPLLATRRWGEERLEAVGSTGTARFVIVDASILEVPLETTEGWRGWFTTDQSERYDGRVEARVEVADEAGRRDGYARVEVRRSKTVPEDASVSDREGVWFDLTEKMMASLNEEMEKQVRANLAPYLR